MNWITRLKERYSKERIRNLGQGGISFKRDFVDIDSASMIGLIVNMNQCSNDDIKLLRNYIDTLLKKKKKIVLIELNFTKKAVSEFSGPFETIFIGLNSLNWLDYPTPEIEKRIQKYDLDILINFDHSDRMTSKYVCSIAKARTRTGMHVEGFEGCYELMIGQYKKEEFNTVNGKANIKTMIKEFDYFLNMIGD